MPAHRTDREPAQPSLVQPLTIGPADHPIREKDIDREALKVLYRLRDAGFSGYLVGGGVRDLYLGKTPKDFDISTNAKPGQLRKLFRNSRTIGRRFRLVQVFFRGNKVIEVSTLRSQSEHDLDGRDAVLPSNNTFGTVEEDAFRRDLTINALFYEIDKDTIIDYVGGVADLNAGIVRFVGEPDRRITRDPVRMMRAIRHAARSGFEIEASTWRAIVANRDKLRLCPPSRIRDELLKDLRSGSAAAWARLAIDSRLLFSMFPQYQDILCGGNEQVQRQFMVALATLDRLHNHKEMPVEIPDAMLFTLFLFPWAEIRFNLQGRLLKGGAYHQLLSTIRIALDEQIGEQFNLQRMARDLIASLLANLITLRFFAGKGWPAWLQKKSYFAEARRFFNLVQEIEGGSPADPGQFPLARETAELAGATPISFSGNLQGNTRGQRGVPSFTSRKKGVFGLKRG